MSLKYPPPPHPDSFPAIVIFLEVAANRISAQLVASTPFFFFFWEREVGELFYFSTPHPRLFGKHGHAQ